jgi:hypothetical protein
MGRIITWGKRSVNKRDVRIPEDGLARRGFGMRVFLALDFRGLESIILAGKMGR